MVVRSARGVRGLICVASSWGGGRAAAPVCAGGGLGFLTARRHARGRIAAGTERGALRFVEGASRRRVANGSRREDNIVRGSALRRQFTKVLTRDCWFSRARERDGALVQGSRRGERASGVTHLSDAVVARSVRWPHDVSPSGARARGGMGRSDGPTGRAPASSGAREKLLRRGRFNGLRSRPPATCGWIRARTKSVGTRACARRVVEARRGRACSERARVLWNLLRSGAKTCGRFSNAAGCKP